MNVPAPARAAPSALDMALVIASAPSPAHCFDDQAAAQMERLVGDLRQMYQERNDALREVTRAHQEALLRLSLAAEYRDDDTGVHITRIGYLVEALALYLGLGAERARQLRSAAPMHDVGKIGIPDSVLKKPGPLTPEEREVMCRHAEIGAGILGRSRIPVFQLAAEIAASHHERWDGRGYPQGLMAEEIPLSGRLVAVADFVDALAMDRVYRRAFPEDQVMRMLEAERGRAFDPAIVDLFLQHREELLALRHWVNETQPGFADLIE